MLQHADDGSEYRSEAVRLSGGCFGGALQPASKLVFLDPVSSKNLFVEIADADTARVMERHPKAALEVERLVAAQRKICSRDALATVWKLSGSALDAAVLNAEMISLAPRSMLPGDVALAVVVSGSVCLGKAAEVVVGVGSAFGTIREHLFELKSKEKAVVGGTRAVLMVITKEKVMRVLRPAAAGLSSAAQARPAKNRPVFIALNIPCVTVHIAHRLSGAGKSVLKPRGSRRSLPRSCRGGCRRSDSRSS